MQQTDALNQGLELGLNPGLDQSLDQQASLNPSPEQSLNEDSGCLQSQLASLDQSLDQSLVQDLNLDQPLGRTEDSAAKGSAESAEMVTEELVAEDPTAMGESEATEKVRVVSETADRVAAGVSTNSTTATEALAAEEGDQMTVGKCEPAEKVTREGAAEPKAVADEAIAEPAEAPAEKPAEEPSEASSEAPAEAPSAEPPKSWFVMRDLKRANAKVPAYKLFMEKKIEVFTPMHTVLKVVKGRQQKVQEPFVRDLLFVHDTRATVDPIVDVTPTLQYRYERGKGYKVPMVVRDAEMNRFILAVTASKSTKYYTPGELSPKMIGRNVRITGGPLEGYAGKLLKISGSRTKRLLVQLEGILSAGVEVDVQYIELL